MREGAVERARLIGIREEIWEMRDRETREVRARGRIGERYRKYE